MNESTTIPELSRARVLIVDDDTDMGGMIDDMLKATVDTVCVATSCSEAMRLCEKGAFDVAIVDINLPDGSGLDLIRTLREDPAGLSFIIISGEAAASTAYRLERMGIQSLLTKPFSSTQLKFSLGRELVRRRRSEKREGNDAEPKPPAQLVGISPYMKDLRRKVRDLAESLLPVLILGPTGTGKEVIAQAIHGRSCRGKKTMMTVNSSAIPEHLEESEFFGYARGAFTGAVQAKDGILKCADGSSLFLDEVGELSLRMQAKLLRVLDGNDFMRVGDTAPQRSDFRLISATNRPLAEMIRSGLFREDLYYRLRAARIVTQALVNHKEDIPPLTDHFLRSFGIEHGREFRLHGDALDVLLHYAWPGNIRELRNTVAALCGTALDTGTIEKRNVLWVLSEAVCDGTVPVRPFAEAKMDFEREYYRGLLLQCGGNISSAARASGIERAYFSKRVRALGLEKSLFRTCTSAVS
jgi:two-component system nitrogen regulation response regulator NtrX